MERVDLYLDDPYEASENAVVMISTEAISPEVAANQILVATEGRDFIR